MFRCTHCKKQSKKGDNPFTRTKYSKELDYDGKTKRGNIVFVEKNNCFKCFKKLGAVIK